MVERDFPVKCIHCRHSESPDYASSFVRCLVLNRFRNPYNSRRCVHFEPLTAPHAGDNQKGKADGLDKG